MLFNKRGIRIFNEYDLGSTLNSQLQRIESEIKTMDLKTSIRTGVVDNLVNEYKVKPLNFQVSDIEVSTEEAQIPSSRFPNSGFLIRPGESYPKDIYTFRLPFEGDETLLRCVPSTRIMSTEQVAIENGYVVFQVIDYWNSVEKVKEERNKVTTFLQNQAQYVNNDIQVHNNKIENFVRSTITTVEDKNTKIQNALAELGKPVSTKKVQPKPQQISQPTPEDEKKYDLFISHAHEDKPYVDVLASSLRDAGLEVWYDTYVVDWGDDLRNTIDNGLKSSRFGIVVLSKSFIAKKKWTEYELSGLFAQERNGVKIVLPVWHDIEREDILKYSPTLADRIAKESHDIPSIVVGVKKLLKTK